MSKLKNVAGAALLIVVVLATFSMAGAATHNVNNSTEYHNSTYSVDNDTQSVYIDVEDTNGTTVHAFFYGIDSGGNVTEVHNETMTAAAGEIVSADTPVNATTYDEYRVVLEGDDTTDKPVSVESGLISKLAGGGGVTLNSTFLGIPLYGVLFAVLAVGALVGVEVYDG